MQKGIFLHPEHLLCARGCAGYWGEMEQTEGDRPQIRRPVLGDKGYTRMQEGTQLWRVMGR